MECCLRLRPPLYQNFNLVTSNSKRRIEVSTLSIRNCAANPQNTHKLVVEVRERLEKEHNYLPVGKFGRDDEEMILWFLKDRKFSAEKAVSKLTKAIRWHHDFGVSELSEESVKHVAETGKAYVHDYLDVYDRPVLIVEASKHFPEEHDHRENEKLCVLLIEKALRKLPDGKEEILGIFDLRGLECKMQILSS